MNVLLFGDLGSNEDGFYHIGDEAMFYSAYLWYRKFHECWEISVITRYQTPNDLKLREYLALPWPTIKKQSKIYFFKLLAKLLIWRIGKKDLFQPEERAFIDILRLQDLVHFTGGGNLTSISTYRYYFYFFVLAAARVLGKRVRLTSQTIGPFSGLDRLVIPFVLNLPEVIGVRENTNGANCLRKFGIVFPKVVGMLDAAFSLPSESTIMIPSKEPGVVRIGLSVHEWTSYGQRLENAVQMLIDALAKNHKVEIVLIPHIVCFDQTGWDSGYMQKVIARFPKEVSVIEFDYDEIMHSSLEPSTTIKYITGQVDLLITSRYHGIVFALSSCVPCITFAMDPYYVQKNSEALKHIYNRDYTKYIVDLKHDDYGNTLIEKTMRLIHAIGDEKKFLESKNKEMCEISERGQMDLYF